MIDIDLLERDLVAAEAGNSTSAEIVRRVLAPREHDTVDEIAEKIRIFIRLFFLASLKNKDAPYHRQIDRVYAEQIHSYLRTGRPRYKGIIIYGFRESAKTTRVKFNQNYLAVYLPHIIDHVHIASIKEGKSSQYTMDMYNILSQSKLPRYFGKIIAGKITTETKESQTVSKFTTTTDVTYTAASALMSNRGAVKSDIADGEVTTKRPKQLILDDIEDEVTVLSLTTTAKIRKVMNSSITGIDQATGFWIVLGNYLSLRGNIAYLLQKHRYDTDVCIIDIPIYYNNGQVAWEDKYVMTDKEAADLANKGIYRVSIESIKRTTDNFETEFLNNPKRSSVYFDDAILAKLEGERVSESERDGNGLLIIEEPTVHDRYVMGVDCATGTGKDQSAFVVWKASGLIFEEVANFISNKIKPEAFAPYSVNVATKYNNALIIPENNYPGNEYIAFARQTYKNIYKVSTRAGDVYGVLTSVKSKPEMFARMKTILLNRLGHVRSQALYNQLSEYPADDVSAINRDTSGGHFDLLMSAVIGLSNAEALSGSAVIPDETIRQHNDMIYTNPQSNL